VIQRRVVLDASAILEWLLARHAKDTIDKLLPVAVIPASALTEALYVAQLRGHGLAPDELAAALLSLGVLVEPVTVSDAVRASELIAVSRRGEPSVGSLSLGDGLCIAVAERCELPVVGGDLYWETLDVRVKVLSFR
jgi:PIN domain nuclease of toxin-antitoxin system